MSDQSLPVAILVVAMLSARTVSTVPANTPTYAHCDYAALGNPSGIVALVYGTRTLLELAAVQSLAPAAPVADWALNHRVEIEPVGWHDAQPAVKARQLVGVAL